MSSNVKEFDLEYAKKCTLAIQQIRTDGGTQARDAMDHETVEKYADKIKGGANFPRLVVFFDGAFHWLADGFHRRAAYELANEVEIPVFVMKGNQRDAILYANGANENHGLPRKAADRRRAVTRMLNDEEWSTWSNYEIGGQCNVSEATARNIRHELEAAGEAAPEATPDDAIYENFVDSAPATDAAATATIEPPDDLSTKISQIDEVDDVAQTRTVKRGDSTYEMRTGNIGQPKPAKATPEQIAAATDAAIRALPLFVALQMFPHSGVVFYHQARVYYEAQAVIAGAHALLSKIQYKHGPVTEAVRALATIPAPTEWLGCPTCHGTLRTGERMDPCPCRGGFTIHAGEGVTADVVARTAAGYTATDASDSSDSDSSDSDSFTGDAAE